MTVNRIHLNELKILSIIMYAVVVSMVYMLLTEKIGEQSIRILFLAMECIILILALNYMRKRKKLESIVFLSIFFTNVLIIIFSAYTVVFLAPLSMISSGIYKISALRNAKIETDRDKFYKNVTYFAMIPAELCIAFLVIFNMWKDIFNLVF